MSSELDNPPQPTTSFHSKRKLQRCKS